MQRLGFSRQAQRLKPLGQSRCPRGFSHLGRQTESERIPEPRKNLR